MPYIHDFKLFEIESAVSEQSILCQFIAMHLQSRLN